MNKIDYYVYIICGWRTVPKCLLLCPEKQAVWTKTESIIINKIYYYINTTEKFEQNLDFVQDC